MKYQIVFAYSNIHQALFFLIRFIEEVIHSLALKYNEFLIEGFW